MLPKSCLILIHMFNALSDTLDKSWMNKCKWQYLYILCIWNFFLPIIKFILDVISHHWDQRIWSHGALQNYNPSLLSCERQLFCPRSSCFIYCVCVESQGEVWRTLRSMVLWAVWTGHPVTLLLWRQTERHRVHRQQTAVMKTDSM